MWSNLLILNLYKFVLCLKMSIFCSLETKNKRKNFKDENKLLFL
jgi:hypothetical protein